MSQPCLHTLMQTCLLANQSATTILVIAVGWEVQAYMWVYFGDETDENGSTLKFLEKVKIAPLQNARRLTQLTLILLMCFPKYLCHDCQSRMHSPSSNLIY